MIFKFYHDDLFIANKFPIMINMTDNTTKLNLNWSAVEKALAEGTFSGYKIGIMETEKLFYDFLEQKKIPGRNTSSKIKYIADFLSRGEQLKYAREIYKKIIDQPHFEISRDETKQVVGAYWQAMLDLEEAITSLTTAQKLKLRFKYFLSLVIKKIKLIAATLAAIILLILFFNETASGKKIATTLGNAIHYLIFVAGPWILGGVLILLALWLGWKILNKRGREF
ncbi:MAG: hypothetical protein A2174_01640 [Candidatus Portnoybacteria bacterium RBG_13_41_18]|uniref:Uncharacterized protein n=1 Tax=Candidatus Portnoybacteria bacterium RBG_13_41_18 TaxID=1801991 RepID=A0A1G2FBB4_9BACT|nr:MAG: hypothetical protein A2174_01640 [Candidatus Portnoybacteria bacterium RBG_13_41_18]